MMGRGTRSCRARVDFFEFAFDIQFSVRDGSSGSASFLDLGTIRMFHKIYLGSSCEEIYKGVRRRMKRKTAVIALALLFTSALAFALYAQLVKAQPDPDLNGDGIVDIQDIATAASAFGSYPDHQRWNPEADLDQNDRVDIKDILLIARNFG